jgi:hypothetical protein
MEPLHRLFKKAQEVGILQKVSTACDTFRVSLYADDASVFKHPSSQDLATITILNMFADVSGLITNMDKTSFYPMQCQQNSLNFLTQRHLAISTFPSTYLGLALHIKKLPKALLQVVIQKIANRMPRSKRNFLTYPGRETLVKSILTAMPTFFLTMFKMPKWGFAKIDKFCRSFLWRGKDHVNIKEGSLSC